MANSDDITHDQHFCLKWNNFQANITSQFDALRCDEEFTDVTIACEGQRLLAHKVVLSACSPYFKELFKANPCSHPIVFMRDVEARHIVALMQFMYVGEVNVAQAHLSAFLKTAESLKIRGLTDTSSELDGGAEEQNSLYMKPQPLKHLRNNLLVKTKPNVVQIKPVTSSQEIELPDDIVMPNVSSPAAKKCKSETEIRLRKEEAMTVNPFALQNDTRKSTEILPKLELPDYISDEDNEQDDGPFNFYSGEYDVTAQSGFSRKDLGSNSSLQGFRVRRKRMADHWTAYSSQLAPRVEEVGYYDFSSREPERINKLVKLAEGIEIYEDQLRSIKWNDYRKLTRGLATILFSPAELATCSVTGQRWSRAGNGERPVKPALDRFKVQAIISYVAARFPLVEVSRIKQVLAYKCKENSTAFKMKAVRHYGSGGPCGD